MPFSDWILFVAGAMLVIEGGGGFIFTDRYRAMTKMVVEAGEGGPGLVTGIFSTVLSAFLVITALGKQPPETIWLWIPAVTFGIAGLTGFLPGVVERLLKGLIIDPSNLVTRTYFILELAIGCLLIWVSMKFGPETPAPETVLQAPLHNLQLDILFTYS